MSELINKEMLEQLKGFIGDKFVSVVEVYLKNADQYVHTIQQGIEEQNAQAVVDAAHPLKSSSGNMGLMVLSGLCEEIETLAEQVVDGAKPISALEELASGLQDVYTQSRDLLRAEID